MIAGEAGNLLKASGLSFKISKSADGLIPDPAGL
jgi:hypothetical protein